MRFNPRAHAGRDADIRGVDGKLCRVSIHAPTRGATMRAVWREVQEVFQSTRPRGARRRSRRCGCVPGCGFNPRAHAGRDAPPPYNTRSSGGFNPRAHAGRDITVRHGMAPCRSFNPRAHAGRDCVLTTT
ncbi:hypothetical protein C664_11935 [Thauera sp. 63]|nr:hypothetical protein C664_11935 [Thauera sp. 63]